LLVRDGQSCTSGSVRDEDGNILIYSAQNLESETVNLCGFFSRSF
jgi:hypothetical protein